MKNKLLKVGVSLAALFVSAQSQAVITYANCPTLAPLPVTAFMPGAMMPIYNTENAFEIGMNQVVRQAVTAAAEIQATAINDSFNTVMESMIKTSQAYQQNKMEVDRQYQGLEMAYMAELADRKNEVENMLFPGDKSMMRPAEGEVRVIDQSSPSYKFIHQMCSAGKMQQMLTSKKVVELAIENKNRRSQKITANIQAISSIDIRAKENIDRHYDIFCSEEDKGLGLCDVTSTAPNADLDAFVFMYPTGYDDATSDYKTAYTYSAVESLASYQYVKHLTGTLYTPPPTTRELNDPRKIRYVAGYKQLVSALSLSTDALLSVAQAREPVNNEGFIMSSLDSVNYLIEKSKMPANRRILKSASENGKLVEMQRQLSIQQRLRYMIYRQNDKLRNLKAANVALENTLNIQN